MTPRPKFPFTSRAIRGASGAEMSRIRPPGDYLFKLIVVVAGTLIAAAILAAVRAGVVP
jgi:hypothetical protein